jgi:uncharacterized protein (UPF0254 family)
LIFKIKKIKVNLINPGACAIVVYFEFKYAKGYFVKLAERLEYQKVEPKYQKEYGKTYDKTEAKEVGKKIAGSQKAKYETKMSKGGSPKKSGGIMILAKQIRKDGETWKSALNRAGEQLKNK